MAYIRNMSYRPVASNRFSNRSKQLLALVAAIVIGMIISATVNAIPSSKTQTVANQSTVSSDVQR